MLGICPGVGRAISAIAYPFICAKALLGHVVLVQSSVVGRAGGVEESHLDRHNIIREHQACGRAGDGENLRRASVAVADGDRGVKVGVGKGVGSGGILISTNQSTVCGFVLKKESILSANCVSPAVEGWIPSDSNIS